MNFFKDIDCAIFDLDGTLVKSLDAWNRVDDIFMRRRGMDTPKGFYDKVAPMNLVEAADYVKAEYGIQESRQEIIDEWLFLLAQQYESGVEMVEGAREFLRKLHQSGTKIALATAAPPQLYRPCLERFGVLDYFCAFASTEEVSRKKGFPDVYLLAAQRAGVSPERCCVFEDIYIGCMGAKAAGMRCIGILEEHSRGDWQRMSEVCNCVIRDYTELLNRDKY